MIVLSTNRQFQKLTWQPTTRDEREVMVLIVIADVEGDHVERAVVRVRFEALLEHVVLGDEVSSDRMKPHGHQGATHHVEEHLAS